jgi:hypothetical protein
MKNSKCLIICLASTLLSGSTLSALGQVFDPPNDQTRFGNPSSISDSTIKPIQNDQASTVDRPQNDGIRQVGWFPFSMPKMALPKVSMPHWNMPKLPSLWQEKEIKQPVRKTAPTSLMTPVKAGAKKIQAGTQSAWTGTKQMLTFGRGEKATSTRSTSARATRQQANKKPSMWKRLFTPIEPERNDPQTITEWMSQPRLDH